MVGDDKGRENLGDYGNFFDFFSFWVGILDFWEHSEQLGALGVWGKGKRGKWVVGWGVWQPLSAPRCSECSGAFGVGVGIFCWWFGFFL